VAITTPVPRPPHRLRDETTAGWRYHATLSLKPVLRRFIRRVADPRSPVRSRQLSTFPPNTAPG